MSKKFNVKKFLVSINENAVLENFFKSCNATDIPFLEKQMDNKNKEELLLAYYKSLDADIRLDALEKMSVINVVANKNGIKYIKEYLEKDNYKPLDIMAETIVEKAIAFYIEHQDKWSHIYMVCKMLKTSGYKRFESVEKNIFNTTDRDAEFVEAITEHLVNNNDAKNISVNTDTFQGNFYTELVFQDAPEMEEDMNDNKLSARVRRKTRSIYFVYIPSSKMLLLKATGNAEEQYYYADTYSRVYLDFNLPPHQYSYDLSKFISEDTLQPFKNSPEVVSWKVISASLYRAATKDSIVMNFNPKNELEGMSALEESMNNFNLKEIGLSINKIKLQMVVKDENSKKGESKVGFTIEEGKSSLNYIKPEHRVVNKILESVAATALLSCS
jgi:hypothetical protein